jgi:SsrA-binding protein
LTSANICASLRATMALRRIWWITKQFPAGKRINCSRQHADRRRKRRAFDPAACASRRSNRRAGSPPPSLTGYRLRPLARTGAGRQIMAKAREKSGKGDSTIALNKRARHEYHIDERYEAGLALQGWEVKSLRAGRINLSEAYALVRNGEIYLFGASIPPLLSASTHVVAEDRRTRKLLLHRQEIDKLIGAVERKGYTIVPTAMYWKHNRVKIELGLAKGKQEHDKRAAEKERDWNREKQRALRARNPSA